MVFRLLSASTAINVTSSLSTKVYGVAWQPGGGELLACATETGGKILNMEHPEAIQLGTDITTHVTWSPAGDLLLTAHNTIRLDMPFAIWTSHGARVATLLGQAGGVKAAEFNGSGSLVAVMNLFGDCDVFNTVTGVLRHSVERSATFFPSMVWKNDLEFFCNSGHNINHWRIDQAEPLRTMNGHGYSTMAMAFNPEKDMLASGDIHGTIKLWSEGVSTLNGHTNIVFEVIWKKTDSGILASYSYGQVRIWDAMSKTTLHIYEGFNFSRGFYCTNQISFSPDGRFFAAAGLGQNVKVVQVSTGETVAQCQENWEFVSWSPGSNKLAVQTAGEVASASVFNLENVMGIKLKTMAMKTVAELLEKNLTNGKEEAEMFLNEHFAETVVSEVLMYLN